MYSFAYLKCTCVFVSANSTDKITGYLLIYFNDLEEQKLPWCSCTFGSCFSVTVIRWGGHGAEGLLPSGYQVISLGVLWSAP